MHARNTSNEMTCRHVRHPSLEHDDALISTRIAATCDKFRFFVTYSADSIKPEHDIDLDVVLVTS